MVEHEFSRIWVSKVIESRRPFRIQNPLLSSVVKFGLVPSLALGVIYATRHEHITSTFLIAYFAILVWLNIGPYLIWYYNRRLQPGFFREANDMVSDSYKLNLLAMKYERLFSRRYWLFSLLGAVAFVALYAISLSVLTTEGGIQGVTDIAWGLSVVVMAVLGALGGIGFWGVLLTILTIREISQLPLLIDPLHSDKMGGLGAVGSYAIGTTLLFSSGSLMLPAAFALTVGSDFLTSFVYLVVFLFAGFTLASFVYPTILIHRKAKWTRAQIVDGLRTRYREVSRICANCNQNDTYTTVHYLELNRLRNEYLDYQEVKLYPFEPSIFAKLATSVILPVIFLLIRQGYISLSIFGF